MISGSGLKAATNWPRKRKKKTDMTAAKTKQTTPTPRTILRSRARSLRPYTYEMAGCTPIQMPMAIIGISMALLPETLRAAMTSFP